MRLIRLLCDFDSMYHLMFLKDATSSFLPDTKQRRMQHAFVWWIAAKTESIGLTIAHYTLFERLKVIIFQQEVYLCVKTPPNLREGRPR